MKWKTLLTKLDWGYPLLLLLGLYLGRDLLAPGWFELHDNIHFIRLYELERCLADGQIPCRWTPDMGLGFGFPMFNFYAPLAYYAGIPLRWLGISLVDTTKLLLWAGLTLPAITAYFYFRSLTSRVTALAGAVLYLTLPYHAVDVFVRGALAEVFAWIFLPVILRQIKVLVQDKHWNTWLVLAIAGLNLSHNITVMWFTPIYLLWAGVVIYHELDSSRQRWLMGLKLLAHVLLGWGLSAFFILPALVEKSLLHQTLNQGYYDFRQHFVGIKQLLWDFSWGYGPSVPGPDDQMSLQIGWPHLAVWLIAIPVLAWQLRKKPSVKQLIYPVFWAGLAAGLIFMLHAKSVYLWQAVELLTLTQFPWRLLGFVGLALACLWVYLSQLLPGKVRLGLSWLLIVLAVVINQSYFHTTDNQPEITDDYFFTPAVWQQQTSAILLDYLPLTVPEAKDIDLKLKGYPRQPVVVPSSPEVNWQADNWQVRSDFFSLDVETNGDQPSQLILPLLYFPEWQVVSQAENQLLPSYPDFETGRLAVQLPPGKHILTGWLRNTLVRQIGNGITLISLIILLVINFYHVPFQQDSSSFDQT